MLIELEDESSWPKGILNIFIEKHEILASYSNWESEQYDLSHRDLDSCISYYASFHQRPSNPYQSERSSILEDINSLLQDSLVIGYHCTRLLKHEVDDINRNGLALPSANFLEKRLQAAVEFGYFTQEEMQELTERNAYLEMPSRENALYFVCGYSALKDDSGIQKFFRCWGGEAIFNPHENQTKLFEKLCKIGAPCIIKVKLEQRQGSDLDLAKRLESTYLYNRKITETTDAVYDYCTRSLFHKEQVLEIIHFDNPEFMKLTEHYKWDDRYRIFANSDFY